MRDNSRLQEWLLRLCRRFLQCLACSRSRLLSTLKNLGLRMQRRPGKPE